MTKTPAPTPILDARIADGSITIIDGAIVGTAADGVPVGIGYMHAADLAERYLTDFPTPDVW